MIYLWSILLLSGVLVFFAGALVLAEKRIARYGTCTIVVEGRGAPVAVEGGGNLIDALREGDIHVPSLCGGQGTCGYCRVTVTSGGGPVRPTELLYLSEDEVRAGVRLACQMRVREDMRIALPDAFLSATRFETKVSGVLELTPRVKEIRLRLVAPGRIDFGPGQYVQVEVPTDRGDIVCRAYSIASPVYETGEIALDVQRVPGGVASTWLHAREVGDVVDIVGPFGDFRIDDDPEVEVVCVAGGCGLAPMKSIVYAVLDRWPERAVWLFDGCGREEDAFHVAVYTRLAQEHPSFRFVCALSDASSVPGDWCGDVGDVHQSVATRLEGGVRRQAFVCGPEAMIAATSEVLKRKGVTNIHVDAF